MKKSYIGFMVIFILMFIVGLLIGRNIRPGKRAIRAIKTSKTPAGKESTPGTTLIAETSGSPKPIPSPSSFRAAKLNLFKPVPLDKNSIYFRTIKYQKMMFKHGGDMISAGRPVSAEMIIREMGIKKGDTVADIGASAGAMTFPVAQYVGPKGRVFSTDINFDALLYQMYLRRELAIQKGFYYENVSLIWNDEDNLTLPESILDFAFVCDVHIYHYNPKDPEAKGKTGGKYSKDEVIELIYQGQNKFTQSIYKSLKSGGKFAIIEENPTPEKFGVLDKKSVIKLMKRLGFKHIKTVNVPEYDHYDFLIFQVDK